MALCDGRQASEFTVAIGGTADAEGRAAMAPPEAIDPSSDIGRPSLLLYVVVLCSEWPSAEATSLNQG